MKKLNLLLLLAGMILSIPAFSQTDEQGLREGDKAPMFKLKDATNKEVKLKSLLKDGPVILLWYRGGWCPYCNLELKEFSKQINQFKELGATLVAISPETPDNSLSTAEKNNLEFIVLSDPNNEVAKQFDIVFKLPKETADRYEKIIGLSKHNGTDSAELPIPATYIITKKGKIEYAYVNPDYRTRATVDEVIEELKKIVKK